MPDSPAGVRALRTLKQVGVELIEPPPGAPFDPLLHSVCGVVQAPDQGLVDSIAAVVRPGLADHGSVLREADVQVYGSASEKTRAVPAIS
jgi:molecular chaperone GrpE (heat shock protein)